MNVNDQWMMNQMQQMTAGMAAALPQVGQNEEAPKTEKGESFQDLINKAKDQKVDAPEKKEDAPKKAEKPENVQKTESARKVTETKNQDGTETRTVNLTAQEAAMVAAGYAVLSPVQPDGTVWLVTAQDENGNPVLPLAELENGGPDLSSLFVQDEWVMEPAEDLIPALEQLLQETGDPRSVEDILGKLEQKFQDPQTQPKVEVTIEDETPEVSAEIKVSDKPVVERPAVENGEQEDEDDSNLDAQVMTTSSQPLFKDVKAAPVKVGENFELDTRQPDMDDKLAATIRMAAENSLRQVEIKLSPENLGNLTIRLTQASDGTLQVVLHTANAKAATLLGQHLDHLNAALQGYGQGEVRVEVQRSDNSQQAEQQPQQQADPDGRSQHQRQQQQEQRQDDSHSGDFVQRLRLGLFGPDDIT